MASSSSEKSKGGFLSCMCWLLGASFKVSTLVVLLALLATVHQLRSSAEENSLKLEIAEKELAGATSQQEDATRAYKEITSQLNQLQTDLADSRREKQELQVQLSKKLDLQKDLDRKTQEAKSAKQESLVLTQKLQELEADVRRKELEQKKDQDTSSVIQSLESEKQQLQQKVSALEASLVQEKNARETATGEHKSLTQTLQETAAKLAQAENLREQLSAKEKAQDRKIEELREQVKKLEGAKKVVEAELESVGKLAAELDRALLELKETRLKISQIDEDSKAKARELQKALAERELMTEKFAATQKERDELKKNLGTKIAKVQEELEQQQRAATQDAQHAKQILDERNVLLKENNELQQRLRDLSEASESAQEAAGAREQQQHDRCATLLEQQQLAAHKRLEEETSNFESEKKEMERSVHLLTAEIRSRDERIEQLSAQVDVTSKKWTECDRAAKEKLSKLQSELEKCQAARDSAVAAEQQRPKADSSDGPSPAAQEQATHHQQCEQELLMYKKEKKDFESAMRDMFQQLDGKDNRIKELEEKAASTQNKLIDVEKTLTDKVAKVQDDLRACLVADAESCAGAEDEESCRSRADCSQLKVRIMDLEASLKSSEEQRQKLTATVQKAKEDWTKANEYADEMRRKAKDAESLARGREEMVDLMREQVMRSAEITHGEIVQELRALAKNHDELQKKYEDDVKPLQEKLEKARKGWLENDKELVDLRKELKREKLRVALCGGDGRE